MKAKKKVEFNKGSLVVESAIVVPICLILACFGVLMLLIQYQKEVGYGAAAGAALAAGADWSDSRKSLSDGSWNSGQDADGLYESLSQTGIGSLLKGLSGESSAKEITVNFAEMDAIAEECRAEYAKTGSSFIDAKYARIMEFLILKMSRSVLIPQSLTFRIENTPGFPSAIIVISVTQRFNVPLIGRISITNRAKAAACAPADFMEGTDLMIEIINRYLPLLKNASGIGE